MKLSLIFIVRSVLGLLCTVIAGGNAFADYVVNSAGDQPWYGNRLGLCETAPFNGVCTLRAAIQASNAIGGTSISFNIPTSDPGYSNGVWTINLRTAPPDITASVNINGPGVNSLFVSHQGDPYSDTPFAIFSITTTGTVNVSNLTIGGLGAFDVTNPGTGVQNSNTGTVNITNCAISYNQNNSTTNSFFGGGIRNDSGTVQIMNSTIEFNGIGNNDQISVGGGIYNGTGTVVVVNSTFSHNNASEGGGIFNGATNISGGVVNVTGCTFHDNGASIEGGAICSFSGTVNVTNSTFYENIAYSKNVGSLTGAGGVGGGISNVQGTLNLTNSTVTANFSAFGGSVYNDQNATTNVKSSIIAANYGEGIVGTTNGGTKAIIGASPDVNGTFNSSGFNLIGVKDGSTGFTGATDKKGTAASPLNPKLDPKGLRSNGGPTQTVGLIKGSPAIDKGTSVGLTGTLTTDQRGFARKVDNSSIPNASGGDGSDIGAYEFGSQ